MSENGSEDFILQFGTSVSYLPLEVGHCSVKSPSMGYCRPLKLCTCEPGKVPPYSNPKLTRMHT